MSMDKNPYKELFVSEAREMLSKLNKCLVDLEKRPQDKECLNEIFRIAHTLKGMAATMSYDVMAELSHKVENLLGLVRDNKIKADKGMLDIVFESVDQIEDLVDLIAKDQEEKINKREVNDLMVCLEEISDKMLKKKNLDEHKERRTNLRLEDEDREHIAKALEDEANAYRVTFSLEKDCVLKEARSILVVKALEDLGKVIRGELILSQIKQGKFGRHFGLFFVTKEQPKKISTIVLKIPEVENIDFKNLETDEITSKTNDLLNKKKTQKSSKSAEEQTEEKNKTNVAGSVQTVRVTLDKLDNIIDIVGELVINKTRLLNVSGALKDKELEEALAQTKYLTDELQIEAMQLRLVPMEYIFGRYPRMIRDLSREENKEINLIVEGSDIGLDRTILDEINEPLVHLLRNAIDHGIETAEERKKAGKDPVGTIKLKARRERNFVKIEVSDDGKGMDLEKIKKVAIEKKFLKKEEAAKIADKDAFSLINLPGFSTSKKVTKTSGRGVGMNSVKTKVESVGGNIQVETKLGQGSKFVLKLPLSMAIVQALLVRVDEETYAVPLVNISETIKVPKTDIKKVENQEVINFRDSVLPLINLREVIGFDAKEQNSNRSIEAVVVEAGHKKAGLIVDKLVGQQEVVIKSLEDPIKNMKGISGATILGDGRVAMIVDVSAISA